jgi:uncharacterized protein YndB with AHSA1/START domain
LQDFKIIKVAIGRAYAEVYEFLADGRNFSAWGGGDPGTAVVPLGGRDWLVQIDGSSVVLRFREPNPFGILDIQAFPHGGQPGPVTPVRLYPSRDGCELCYVHFRHPEQPEEQFASAAEWLESDLLRLKSFLEQDRPLRTTYRSNILSVSIERPVNEVFRFLLDPRNYPKWASVTGHRFEYRDGRDWLVDATFGPRIVRFAEPNDYGVLDHAVFEEGDEPVFGPMRAVANGEGTLLTFTFFQRSGFTDEGFASTVEWIATDLLTAKSLLEV